MARKDEGINASTHDKKYNEDLFVF